MSRGLRRTVPLAYVGAAAAWLAYATYLGISYDMLPEVVIGAVKILVAVTAFAGFAVVAVRWVSRRLGRSAFSRGG